MTIYLNKHWSYNTKNKSILYESKHMYTVIFMWHWNYTLETINAILFTVKKIPLLLLKQILIHRVLQNLKQFQWKSIFPMHTVL